MCKGTQQFVHRSCLDHWRSVKANFFILVLLCCSCLWLWRICLFPFLFSYNFNQSERIPIFLQEGFAFSHCTTCKAQFHLKVSLFEDNSWRKVKFRLFVARDVLLVFIAVQTVSCHKFSTSHRIIIKILKLECLFIKIIHYCPVFFFKFRGVWLWFVSNCYVVIQLLVFFRT